MAKIYKTDIYGFDLIPTLNDYLIGTDGDSSSKLTKNYKLSTIASLVTQVISGIQGNALISGSVVWLQDLDYFFYTSHKPIININASLVSWFVLPFILANFLI